MGVQQKPCRAFVHVGLAPVLSCYPRPRLIQKILDRVVQAVSRGTARCALHVHGRGARTDTCGRCFAELTAQVLTAGLRLRLVL